MTLLEVRRASKRYGGVQALDAVDVTVSAGAIHGLLGKNGAGKSTLAGVIGGRVQPDEGEVRFDGQDVTGLSIEARQELGLRVLSQHTEIFPHLSVAENILTPRMPRRRGLIDWRAARRAARDALERYHLDLPVDAPAGTLRPTEQRQLNIVRALAGRARLVVLDEPTTALTLAERRGLFAWINQLLAQGTSFVYISHHNDEVRQLCTEYTVLRGGRVTGAQRGGEGLDAATLARLITGDDVVEFERASRAREDTVLALEELVYGGHGPVSLTLRAGEIVGLIGLPGSGARELLRALGGLVPITGGTVELAGRTRRVASSGDARRAGLAFLSDDRLGEGLVADMSVADNLHLGGWPVRRGGLLDRDEMDSTLARARERFNLTAAGAGSSVSHLSGGNQQKVMIERLLSSRPAVLLLDEPTLGIDVAAKEDVHRMIDQATTTGVGALVRAYDPEELARLVDRALVFRDGRVVDELAGDGLTVERAAAAQQVAV